MHARTRDFLARSWQSEVNLSLFFFLLVVLAFVLPWAGFENEHFKVYADVAFSVMLICGSGFAWQNRRLFALTSLVSVVAMVMRWAVWWSPTFVLWSAWTGLAAIFMIMAVLLWQVFSPGPVTVMRIQGAIAAYLGLAFGWAHAYHIAALLNPGSFSYAGSEIPNRANWINYSFGTLTTLGYAGITPARPLAHSLSSAEAVTGQLYLAVLVARLVSMQVSSPRKDA